MQKSIDIKEVAEALVEEHGARMTRNHKSQFRDFVVKIAEDMGYDAAVENCFLAKNVVVGNPKTAEIVLTAHYDTPPNMPMSFVKKQLVGMGIGVPCVVGTGHETTEWFQIRKGVHQGYILSPCLFNLYSEYIMRNSGLEETQAGIKMEK